MNKLKKKRQKKSTNPKKEMTVTEALTLQPFEKSLFYSIIFGSIFSTIPAMLIFLMISFLRTNFPPADSMPLFLVLYFIMSVLVIVWLNATPCFSISKNEIIVIQSYKQNIHYTISPSLHIKITMMVSANSSSGTFHGLSCLLFMTFMDDQLNIKKRWISGYYSHEQARDLIFALEDNNVRYYLKGGNAQYFAWQAPYDFRFSETYRKIKESTL